MARSKQTPTDQPTRYGEFTPPDGVDRKPIIPSTLEEAIGLRFNGWTGEIPEHDVDPPEPGAPAADQPTQ